MGKGAAAEASGADPFDRPAKELRHGRRLAPGEAFTFGIPSPKFLDFQSFGSAAQARAKEYAAAWDRSVEALQAIGGTCVEVDYAPFQEAANLLYQGPWVAERLAAIAALLQEDPEVIEPTVRKIVEQGHQYTAQQCFEASYRMRALQRAAEASMEAAKAQVLVTPTVGATYKIEDVLADPIALNTNLGRFTNHMNLLDLCGLAVPTAWASDALPFGVTISAQAGSDAYICDIGQRLGTVGALEAAVEDVEAAVAVPPTDPKGGEYLPDALKVQVPKSTFFGFMAPAACPAVFRPPPGLEEDVGRFRFPPSRGSWGHPELCQRPCVHLAKGKACLAGASCCYCHGMHCRPPVKLDQSRRLIMQTMQEEDIRTLLWPHIQKRLEDLELAEQASRLMVLLASERELESSPQRAFQDIERKDLRKINRSLARLPLLALVKSFPCSSFAAIDEQLNILRTELERQQSLKDGRVLQL
ncbi:Allophanate hydrolase [Symbiodinium microadriaticum]|uniref:Allophanate hydrolase n=1 Tax=Symbiodinium microadriaticum TaxID=2951 RepID=A0A1Q9C3M6_SYMMI|nr:Allophanate hydrolase [Symbiodinium microadriaticum]